MKGVQYAPSESCNSHPQPLEDGGNVAAICGKGFVSVEAQADNQHDRQVLSTLSVPVGQHARVQAGAGKSALVRALRKANGNCHLAAKLLGISRYTVYRMMARFGLGQVKSYRENGVRDAIEDRALLTASDS